MSLDIHMSLTRRKFFNAFDSLITRLDGLAWSEAEILEMTYETMLFIYNYLPSEMKREIDINPSFLKFRKGEKIDVLEEVSFECKNFQDINDLIISIYFSGEKPPKYGELYLYRVIHILERNLDFTFDLTKNDIDYNTYNSMWV